MSSAHINTTTTSSGKVRAVCEFCGRMSRPVVPGLGRLTIWDLSAGWSCAPYPETFTHDDGSTGSLWQCPGCTRRLDRGEGLRPRQYAACGAPVGRGGALHIV